MTKISKIKADRNNHDEAVLTLSVSYVPTTQKRFILELATMDGVFSPPYRDDDGYEAVIYISVDEACDMLEMATGFFDLLAEQLGIETTWVGERSCIELDELNLIMRWIGEQSVGKEAVDE